MSQAEIKGIVLDKIPLNVMNKAFMQKLEKFGCVISMDEQGNDKLGKAQLAILNVMDGRNDPSILIITKQNLMYAWYRTILTGIGADFKFITSNDHSINHFAPKLSNLYITHEEAGTNPIFDKIKQAGLVWDLVIIDGGLSETGINTDLILEGFDLKTKRLAVFAPYLPDSRTVAEKLTELPRKFLNDAEQAAYFESNIPDEGTIAFTLSTPYMRYYGKETLSPPKIRTVTYKVNDDVLKERARQPHSTVYHYGGNIFEELTLDMRKLYIDEHYDDDTVTQLKNYDTKLGAYLDELNRLLENPENRIITYFSSEKTLDYVYRVLCSSLVNLGKITSVRKTGIYGIEHTLRYFKAENDSNIRIVLSPDNQDEQCGRLKKITHIINYELPDHPLILHRRYKQSGSDGFIDPEFIIFRDETDEFDGRMLKGPLALNFCEGYNFGVPGRNIYMFIDGAEKMLASMLYELEGAEQNDAAFFGKMSAKYNLHTTADRAKLSLCYGRNAVKTAFDVPDGITENKTADIIGKKLTALKESCCCFDGEGRLKPVKYDPESSDEYREMSAGMASDPLVVMRDKARAALDSFHSEADCFRLMNEADENERAGVDYCVWRYLVEHHGLQSDYNEFLEAFYEELI